MAQNNYCDDLTRDTDKVANTITWKSPDLNITLRSVQSSNGVEVWANFNVKYLSEMIIEDGGLFIRFESGKSLKYFGQRVSHTFISNRDGYYYQTDLKLSPEVIERFQTQKIIRFQIASIDVPVTTDLAAQIEAYAVCMSGMK